MTAEEAQHVVAFYRTCWPGAPWRAENMGLVLSVWSVVMADVTPAEAEAVMIEIARSGVQFPPAPGEIVARVIELREIRDKTAAPSLDLALSEVQHYIAQRGERRGPPKSWSHRAVAAAVRAIGWSELCQGGDVTRAHFLRVYEEARRRTTIEQRMSPAMRALLESEPLVLHKSIEIHGASS